MSDSWRWVFTVVVLGIGTLTVFKVLRWRRWRPVGKLGNIYIYPLKSGKCREIGEAECTVLGVRCPAGEGKADFRDRVFVVYDEEKMERYTAKMNSTLIFITVEPKSLNSVVFTHPKKDNLEVYFPCGKFEGNIITMWKSEPVEILDCGDKAAKWISELVLDAEKGLRIGYWPEQETWRRDPASVMLDEVKAFKYFSNRFMGAYSDLSSYMLINKSSVDDLNSRINHAEKTEVLNYRPNFVIEGAEPYVEDKWNLIKIGDAVFRNFRPCTRCVFTTINHKTGEKHPATEPLTTLRSYRTMKQLGLGKTQVEGGVIPVMGIYIGLETPGTIRKGDIVHAC